MCCTSPSNNNCTNMNIECKFCFELERACILDMSIFIHLSITATVFLYRGLLSNSKTATPSHCQVFNGHMLLLAVQL